MRAMLAAYRRLGADPPFGNLRRPHGVAMEGWFWRVTDVRRATVVVVLASLDRRADGHLWGTVGLAVHGGPGPGRAWTADTPDGHADAAGRLWLGERGGRTVLEGGPGGVRVDLGAGATAALAYDDARPWPRRGFGALGPAQALPGLSQYWHPHVLHARVAGTAAGLAVDGAAGYAERNWSPSGGFPSVWWWGQAHGFDRPDLCVAFAGGLAGLGPLRTTATALVVAAGDRVLRVVRPPQPLRIAGGGWVLRGRTARGTRVEVEGAPGPAPPHRLPVPLPAEGRSLPGAAAQHLAGTLRVALHRRRRRLYEGTSHLAGLERGEGGP